VRDSPPVRGSGQDFLALSLALHFSVHVPAKDAARKPYRCRRAFRSYAAHLRRGKIRDIRTVNRPRDSLASASARRPPPDLSYPTRIRRTGACCSIQHAHVAESFCACSRGNAVPQGTPTSSEGRTPTQRCRNQQVMGGGAAAPPFHLRLRTSSVAGMILGLPVRWALQQPVVYTNRPTMAKPTGIRERHGRYEAWVWSRSEKKKIRRTFNTLAEAKSWRADAIGAVRRGQLRARARALAGRERGADAGRPRQFRASRRQRGAVVSGLERQGFGLPKPNPHGCARRSRLPEPVRVPPRRAARAVGLRAYTRTHTPTAPPWVGMRVHPPPAASVPLESRRAARRGVTKA